MARHSAVFDTGFRTGSGYQYKWVDPGTTTIPGAGNLKNLSEWFKQNPWQNQFADLINKYGTYSSELMQRSAPVAPTSELNTAFSSPEAFRRRFGFDDSSFGPNSESVQGWLAHLRGNTQNLLNEAVNRMSQAGIGASRGGYGISTGVDPRSRMALDATKQLAGQYGQDFAQAAEWARQANAIKNQIAEAMLGGYKDIYQSDIEKYKTAMQQYGIDKELAGKILGLEAQATQGAAQSFQDYMNKMYGAYGGDIGQYNQYLLAKAAKPEDDYFTREMKKLALDKARHEHGELYSTVPVSRRDYIKGALFDQTKRFLDKFRGGLDKPFENDIWKVIEGFLNKDKVPWEIRKPIDPNRQ